MMEDQNETPLQELLAGEVLGDLDTSEKEHLTQVISEQDNSEIENLERVAAQLLLMQKYDKLPTALRVKVESDALEYFSNPSQTVPRHPGSITRQHHRKVSPSLVVAVMFLAAFLFWIFRPNDKDLSTSLELTRADLLKEADVIQVDWTEGKTPFDKKVEGNVVWSTRLQKGVMQFVDMPVNDPSVEQYQLWIIDPQRDEEPIGGGVFNIESSGQVTVPIDAKLKVIAPTAFAVTIEKPGGVVVSTQERLPLLAVIK